MEKWKKMVIWNHNLCLNSKLRDNITNTFADFFFYTGLTEMKFWLWVSTPCGWTAPVQVMDSKSVRAPAPRLCSSEVYRLMRDVNMATAHTRGINHTMLQYVVYRHSLTEMMGLKVPSGSCILYLQRWDLWLFSGSTTSTGSISISISISKFCFIVTILFPRPNSWHTHLLIKMIQTYNDTDK